MTRMPTNIEVQVDLLVPSVVSPGKGRRAARLPGHDDHAARKVDGLEGVLVDQVEMEIGSLEPIRDSRRVMAKVAGARSAAGREAVQDQRAQGDLARE